MGAVNIWKYASWLSCLKSDYTFDFKKRLVSEEDEE